jgi:hypothetical protein
MKINIKRLSTDALIDLRTQIEALLRERVESERQELQQRLADIDRHIAEIEREAKRRKPKET